MKNYSQDYYRNNHQLRDRPALGFYADVFKKYIQKGKVLDFGAGSGFLSRNLSTTHETYAYDISSYAKSSIRKVSPTTKLVSKTIQLKLEYFDGIICLHTMEHLKQPGEIIRRMNMWLKKDGILFIVVPNPNGLGHKIKKTKWFGYKDKTHISLFSAPTWKQLCIKAGFTIVKVSSDGFWDVPYLPAIPSFVQKLIFYPSCLLLLITKKLCYPEWFGECLIIVAKRT